MAKKGEQPQKKKRTGIVQRMMFGDADKPDLTAEQLEMSKWALFKYLFSHKFGTLVLLNLLTLIFALPGIVVIVLFYLNSTIANGFIPYSSNLGIGYPVVNNAVNLGVVTSFTYSMFQSVLLIPCIAVFAMGISGNLYVIRRLIWDQPTRTAKDFFRGVGKCWWQSLLIGLFFGMTINIVVFSLGYFDAYHLPVAYKAVSVTLAMILLVFMILFSSFFLTQNAAFKMRLTVLVKNSVLFVIGAFFQSVIIIGIALIPVYLLLIPGALSFMLILYFFLGISFTTVVISLFCHHCYKSFLYDKIKDKPEAVYGKRESGESATGEPQKKKAQPTTYKNPKKRKKSIDEGASITPLAPTFRREDLERLQREHEQIMSESADDEPEPEETVETPQDEEVTETTEASEAIETTDTTETTEASSDSE